MIAEEISKTIQIKSHYSALEVVELVLLVLTSITNLATLLLSILQRVC